MGQHDIVTTARRNYYNQMVSIARKRGVERQVVCAWDDYQRRYWEGDSSVNDSGYLTYIRVACCAGGIHYS